MTNYQKELVESVRRFCWDQIEPLMESDDEKGIFRKDLFIKLGQLGFTGITTPEAYGGLGLTYLDFSLILEEMAKVSVPYAVTVSVSSMVQSIIFRNGSEEQKSKYLPLLSSGQEIGAFALSESHSGSDAANLKTTAKKNSQGYILNGTKMWITSGGEALVYIVMCRTGETGRKGISAFIVEKGTPGFSFGKAEKKMGWKTSPTRELIFENCLIPESNLIGNLGDGFKIAKEDLDKGRITIGAIGVGCAQRAFDEAFKYCLSREQFNQQLINFQGLQFMLADMEVDIQSSRLLVQHAAHLYDQGKQRNKMSSIAKLKATDTAMKVSTDAVQILGGVGITKEYPVERFMRDAKILQIVEGTNQIQRIVIANELKKDFELNE